MTGKPGEEAASVVELVEALYPALAAGDRTTIQQLLAEDFVGTVTESLPLGIGGVHHGPDAMIDEVWWALGRNFKLRAEPVEWIPCAGGRLLVLGRYIGQGRQSGAALDAAFAHLWTARSGRLVALSHLTDSHLFHQALTGAVPPGR